ncbi:MAG: glucose-1-phosphate thymidylyltransferase [Candidatus Cloacimonadota bacterium]|nr:MAG: glucose-1-phosphate thymidylyltransferase [Candidatus Cloacimonadota bacterium]PIE78831.1 MAG: glucose-1-phosphate thymidylyltransferase [Candidatus Delongbacteria bacterium]
MKNLLIIEQNPQNYYPVSLNRRVSKLFSGMMSFEDRVKHIFSEFKIFLNFREKIDFYDEIDTSYCNEDIYFIESTIKDLDFVKESIRSIPKDRSKVYKNGETLLYGFIKASDIEKFYSRDFSDIECIECNLEYYRYLWEIVNDNHSIIERDFSLLKSPFRNIEEIDNVTLVNRENIFVRGEIKIKAGSIIDGSEGVVVIDEGSEILHNSVVIGPVYIGHSTKIKIGSKIYENCSFGPVCKIGGEVEAVIFQGYSNKQHDGFLGHAYIGSWCNFGADTNNSDLKNNYRKVKVELNGELIDTESQFAGLFMGDHTKTGINTMFDTGTVVGMGCNVYGEGFPKRVIPSFNWGGKSKLIKYPVDRIIETSKVVMSRRSCSLSSKEEEYYRDIFREGESNAW